MILVVSISHRSSCPVFFRIRLLSMFWLMVLLGSFYNLKFRKWPFFFTAVVCYERQICAQIISQVGKRILQAHYPKQNCVFSTSPDCLCHSVIYRCLRKEYISDFEIEPSNLLPNITHTISIFLNTMFASWVAGCPPNSDLGRPKKSLRNAVLEDWIFQLLTNLSLLK